MFVLFNGILIFMVYLMPNPSFFKNSGGTIQPIAEKDKGILSFSRVFVQKWT